MKEKNLKCYYHVFHKKNTSWSIINMVLIRENTEVIYMHSKKNKYKGKNNSLFALQLVLDELEKVLTRKEFDLEYKVEILTVKLPLLQNSNLIGQSIDIYNKIKLILHKYKNWSLAQNSKTLDFIKKYSHIKKQNKKSGTNRSKFNQKVLKVNDLIRDSRYQLVFFDVEMNCNDRNTGEVGGFEVIAIGAVKIVNNSVVYNDTFYSTIKPNNNSILSGFCKDITKLTQEQINNSKDFKTVLREFENWVGGTNTIFISWGREDIRALKRDNKNNGARLQIVNRIRNKHIDFQKEFSVYKLKSKNVISLIKAIEQYNFRLEGVQHNPKDDSINTAKVYLQYINKL